MSDFIQALQNGSGSLWLFIPAAVLLGALHGLEPGHSKTMMAAFIVAIRGTMGQAVLLGLSAAISHSLLIWILAAAALHFGNQWNVETVEPYLQLGSAVLILALALWMFLRTRREVDAAGHHHHGHEHGHDHAHGENFMFDLGPGNKLELSVFEEGVPPVFQLRAPAGQQLPAAADVSIETVRLDGSRQMFQFIGKNDFLEATTDIPEPHEFDVTLTLRHRANHHAARVEFREAAHYHQSGMAGAGGDFQDAHERAHAEDIARRFAGRTVTTPQIILFGVTGGLMPCPAAFTVLLVCLQLKRVAWGFAMVGAFSFGLALTMVTVGALAAWSVRHAEKKFSGFGELMRRAPYVSCVLLVLLASYMGWHGWHGLNK
ncbi:MAG: sulfite exporter TauE/SafE family protein [Verrucomicrobiae bacterium]|nr:sulfite exporter TauE/SafE family protein [Verrucomicrobiae bacterium]